MRWWPPGGVRYAQRLIGAFAVMLGLASQSALITTMQAAPEPRLFAAVAGAPICHAGPADTDSVPHVPAHHPADCALCPLCAALGGPVPILASVPGVPTPGAFARGIRREWRQARAPPTAASTAAYPRGPPILA